MNKQDSSRIITCHKAWMTHLLYTLLPASFQSAVLHEGVILVCRTNNARQVAQVGNMGGVTQKNVAPNTLD